MWLPKLHTIQFSEAGQKRHLNYTFAEVKGSRTEQTQAPQERLWCSSVMLSYPLHFLPRKLNKWEIKQMKGYQTGHLKRRNDLGQVRHRILDLVSVTQGCVFMKFEGQTGPSWG